MKILQLVGYFQPAVGYEEYYLSKSLIKFGHQVIVVTSDRYYPYTNYNSIYANILGNRNTPRVGFRSEYEIPTLRLPTIIEFGTSVILRRLKETIKKFQPDIIHVHGIYFPLTIFILFIVKMYFPKIKVIVDEHETIMFQERSPIKKLYLNYFSKVIIRFFRNNHTIHRIYATKEVVKKHITKHHGITVPIIPLGVDTQLFNGSRYDINEVRSELQLEDKFILFHSGKLTPGRKILALLKLFNELNKKYDVGLLIVGSGSDQFLLRIKDYVNKNNLSRNFRILPFMQHHQLPKYMASANLGCWIGKASASINEFLGTGRPILIKTFEGYDLVKQGHCFAKKYESHGDSVNWISKIIENENKYITMCKNARTYALNHLNWEKTSKEVEKLYMSW